METKLFTLKNPIAILLLISVNSNAQSGKDTLKMNPKIEIEDGPVYETLEDFTTYLFINSAIEGGAFNYRKAIRRSREHTKTIVLDSTKTTSTALLKVFKKAANKAEDYKFFKSILLEKLKTKDAFLTEAQGERIYASFRASTFNGYLDEVRLALRAYD